MGRYEEALAAYARSLELDPDHPGTLANRGNTFEEMGRDKEALADYNRALMVWPDFAPALTWRGSLLHRLGRDSEALEDLNRARTLFSTMGNEAAAGQVAKRIADLQSALTEKPNQPGN